MNLIDVDNATLIEWERLNNEIKTFIHNHIDTIENKEHLIGLINKYETLVRMRSRIISALLILR